MHIYTNVCSKKDRLNLGSFLCQTSKNRQSCGFRALQIVKNYHFHIHVIWKCSIGTNPTILNLTNNYNQSKEWFELAPPLTLEIVKEMNETIAEGTLINFENVVVIAQLIEQICQFNTSTNETTTDDNEKVVSIVLDIINMLLEWDALGFFDDVDVSSVTSTAVAIKIYAALDNLANLIVASTDRLVPYLFSKTFVAVQISKKILDDNDTIHSLNISNTAEIKEIRNHQIVSNFYFVDDHKTERSKNGFSSAPPTPTVLLLTVNAAELDKEFRYIRT